MLCSGSTKSRSGEPAGSKSPRLTPAKPSNRHPAPASTHPASQPANHHERVRALRALFERFADLNVITGVVVTDQKGFKSEKCIDSTSALSCGEWLALIENLGLVEAGHIAELDARLIFLWSRMRVVSGHSDRDHERMRHLLCAASRRKFMLGNEQAMRVPRITQNTVPLHSLQCFLYPTLRARTLSQPR